MSDGWEGLPRVEDLPKVESGGYDPLAVAAAFDAFYRHAAEVDATLRVLESVDAFQKQAGDLRADLRALRAASWGPMPAVRPSYTPAYTVRPERFGGFDLVPRLAIEAAFIIAVALGAAAAGLAAVWVIALVAGAWLVVGAAEVVASAARPRLRTPSVVQPTPRPEPAQAEPAAAPPFGWPETEPAAEPEPAGERASSAQPEPVPVPVPEAQPRPPRRFWWRRPKPEAVEEEPWAPRHVRVLEPVPAAEAEPVAEAGAESEAIAEPAPEPEPDGWEAPPSAPEPTLEPQRRRFWQRGRDEASAADEATGDGQVDAGEVEQAVEAAQSDVPQPRDEDAPEFPSLTPTQPRPVARSLRRGRR